VLRKSFLLAYASCLLFAACLGQSDNSVSQNQHAIPPKEREALLALYTATDGDHWKDNDGWLGPPGTECDWHGVGCGTHDSPIRTVTALQLGQNSLNGAIPEQLGDLTNLEQLELFDNRLTGTVPEPLIRRWLSGALWVGAEGALFTDVSEIDFELDPSALLCGSQRIILRPNGGIVHFSKLCRKASPKDRTTFCEVKRGEIWPQYFAKLAWLLNSNGFYELRPNYDRNMTEGAFESTRVVMSGKVYEVVNYADAGPFALWVIQRAIESTVADAEWASTKRQADCPRWEKGEIEESFTKK
jgi:hypothetical protein